MQTTTNSRWGDYTSLNVDPVDDCTFWYVNEYYTAAGQAELDGRLADADRLASSCPAAADEGDVSPVVRASTRTTGAHQGHTSNLPHRP